MVTIVGKEINTGIAISNNANTAIDTYY